MYNIFCKRRPHWVALKSKVDDLCIEIGSLRMGQLFLKMIALYIYYFNDSSLYLLFYIKPKHLPFRLK